MIELSKLSDQQLMDRVQTIDRKLAGTYNEEVIKLMCDQKELIMFLLSERRQMETLKATSIEPISLTDDDLSRKEKYDEEKDKQQKNQ